MEILLIPPFVCPSIALSPPKPLGGILRNLLHHFPSGKDVREQHYFLCVRPFVHFSVTLSPPKPLMEFNQTCYITSLHGKGCESNVIFPCVSRSGPLHNLLLNHWGNSVNLSLIVRVCESNIIFPSARRSSICSSRAS